MNRDISKPVLIAGLGAIFGRYILGEIMTSSEIIDLYDRKPDLTLRQLQNITGRSIAYLKGLLMHPEPAQIDTTMGAYHAGKI